MKIEVFKINEIRHTGRIFTQRNIFDFYEEFAKMKKDKRAVLGEFTDGKRTLTTEINFGNISHEVMELYQEDDVLYANINTFGNNEINERQYILTPRFYGTVNDDMTMNVCGLIAFDLMKKEFKFLK